MFEQRKEAKTLRKLNEAFNESTTLAVWAHFEAIGKRRDLIKATSEKEHEELDELAFAAMHGRLPPEESRLTLLRLTEGFMRSALRIGADTELAGCLPDRNFQEKDVAFLKERQLPSLAAVVQAKLGISKA